MGKNEGQTVIDGHLVMKGFEGLVVSPPEKRKVIKRKSGLPPQVRKALGEIYLARREERKPEIEQFGLDEGQLRQVDAILESQKKQGEEWSRQQLAEQKGLVNRIYYVNYPEVLPNRSCINCTGRHLQQEVNVVKQGRKGSKNEGQSLIEIFILCPSCGVHDDPTLNQFWVDDANLSEANPEEVLPVKEE